MASRRVVAADAAAWRALRLRALRKHPEAFGSDYDESRSRPLAQATAFLHRDSATTDDFVLGAFAAERPVGTIGFQCDARGQGAPQGRGQGLGQAVAARDAPRLAPCRDWNRSRSVWSRKTRRRCNVTRRWASWSMAANAGRSTSGAIATLERRWP